MKRKLTVNWQLATVESRLGANCQRDKCYRAAQVDIHNTLARSSTGTRLFIHSRIII